MKNRSHFGHAFMAAIFTTLITLGATPATAGEAHGIQIHDPWARASAGMAAAAGAFMMIYNKGDADDRLIGASTPAAGMTQVHETAVTDSVMTMRHVEAIAIPAGGKVELAPGGLHVMLMKLAAPLKEGTHFPLTLTFEKAGTVQIDVPVMKPGAMHGHNMGTHKNDQDHNQMHMNQPAN